MELSAPFLLHHIETRMIPPIWGIQIPISPLERFTSAIKHLKVKGILWARDKLQHQGNKGSRAVRELLQAGSTYKSGPLLMLPGQLREGKKVQLSYSSHICAPGTLQKERLSLCWERMD